jgi:hypothetical protein
VKIGAISRENLLYFTGLPDCPAFQTEDLLIPEGTGRIEPVQRLGACLAPKKELKLDLSSGCHIFSIVYRHQRACAIDVVQCLDRQQATPSLNPLRLQELYVS